MRTALAIIIAIASFAVFPACFLSRGTRAPRPQPSPPEHGDAIGHGGQRLRAPLPADPAAAARAALVTRGWTVVASAHPDEALAVIHDNVAVIHWSADGWWVRVDQQSSFDPPHRRLPPWDHPWEALRLLHLCTPDKVPAVGWSEWPAQQAFDLAFAVEHRCDPYTRWDPAIDVGAKPAANQERMPYPHQVPVPAAEPGNIPGEPMEPLILPPFAPFDLVTPPEPEPGLPDLPDLPEARPMPERRPAPAVIPP